MLFRDYDVAVVGAGPSGSTAARVIAENGLRVLLLERRREIGIPIQCGELLPTPREMIDLFPNSPRAPRLADVPPSLVTNKSNIMRLVSPRMNVFDFGLEMNILDRSKFDRHLADRAEEAGANLQLRSRVIERTGIHSLRVRTKNSVNIIRANIIVGADGPNSLISHSIGNRYSNLVQDVSHSIQHVYTGIECDSDVTEMLFGDQIAPGGYAWFIPKDSNTANVGLGLRYAYSQNQRSLRWYIKNLTKRNPYLFNRLKKGTVERRVSALIPVGGPVTRTHWKNTILVGDAAGHVMASNGGGIPAALIGGEIAGEVIANHLQEATSLSEYEQIWKSEIGNELRTAVSVRQVADQVMVSDSLTDQCMRLAGSSRLESLIRCRLPFLVDLASKTFVRVLKRFE
ncbi:MAG: geranylgeranyl reductase family protein [Candidatus Hodarchaeota archaeon]